MKIDTDYLLDDDGPSIASYKKKSKKVKKTVDEKQEGLKKGRVVFLSPDAIYIHSESEMYPCSLKGNLKKELKSNRNRLACGDMVYFDPEKKLIVSLEKRHTILMRQNPSHKHKEQILATNIDLLLITASILEPQINPYLIDLYLIAAQRADLKPIILINKMDLLKSKKDPIKIKNEKALIKTLQAQYKKLGIPVLLLSADSLKGCDALKEVMKDKASVFSGESGVGKSSLINALGKSTLKVAPVSLRSKGTHTTTSSQLLELETGGWCVDTPGIQSFGFKDLEPDQIKYFFPEFDQLNCKFADCKHIKEKGCGIEEAVEKKLISPLRLASYYKILEELDNLKT